DRPDGADVNRHDDDHHRSLGMTLSKSQIRLIAIFAGVNIVLIAAGWMALVAPQRHQAATAAAAAALAQGQLHALGGPSPGTHGAPKQPAIHTSCLYKLDTALPSQVDQPSLLLELGRVAKASGVDLLSVSPQAAQGTAFGYTVLPINISLSG